MVYFSIKKFSEIGVNQLVSRLKKLAIIIVTFVFLQFSCNLTYVQAATFAGQVKETKTEISPQVKHIQQTYVNDSIREFVNVLDINLNSTYTKLELGVPNPVNSLNTPTNMAKENSYTGHRVVGAVNASYFLGNGMPANLLAKNNEILNYGILGDSSESPTQYPVAFGVSKTGKAIADEYTTNLSFEVNGKRMRLMLLIVKEHLTKQCCIRQIRKQQEQIIGVLKLL